LLLVLIYVAVCCGAGIFISEVTLHPGRRVLKERDQKQAQEMARRHNSLLVEVVISSLDGTSLQAWSIHPQKSNGDAVILLHGLGDNRMGMIGYAEMLVNRGFTVLMPDARAHGASGGTTATFGLLESDDIRRWLAWVQDHEHPNCVFGFGESMGAAQLLQSLAVKSNFCAVAAESPFASFREIAYDRVGQFFHTGPWLGRSVLRPVVEIAFWYSRRKYGFNFEKVSPELAVAASRIPILLIHGRDDRNIPVRHSRAIALENPDAALWEVPGADHCGAISVAGEEFERRVVAWFEQHDQPERTITWRRNNEDDFCRFCTRISRIATSIYVFRTTVFAPFRIFPV
jgi:hypothetical protein